VPACLSSPIPAAAHAAAPAALTSDQCRSLLEDLAQLADRGQRCGRRHALVGVLGVAVCAVLAGAKSLAAIGEWAADAPGQVLAALRTRRDPLTGAFRPPAEATVRRVLARVDPDALDRAIGQWLTASSRRPPHPSEHASWLVTHKHADDLLLVKANQPTLHRQLQRLPWPQVPVADHTHNRGHGRVEVRRLQVTTIAGLDFPHATQALRITRRVRPLHGRRWRTVTVYAITSLTTAQARPARMADYIRGHWSIEALHHIRDVTLAEDASQVCTRTAPRAMASLPTSPSPPWCPWPPQHRRRPALLRPRRYPRPSPARHHQPVNPTSPHLPGPWDRGCRVAERSYLMLWLSLAHAQGLGSRTCRQERRAAKRRIGLARPGSSMAPIPSKRTPATEVIATTGSLTSTWPPRA
jgi:DDE_Tnp_1-associated